MDKLSKKAQNAKVHGIEFWDNGIPRFGEPLGYDLELFPSDFPFDVLYYDPIRLSMWN
jgi:hypothetical protein